MQFCQQIHTSTKSHFHQITFGTPSVKPKDLLFAHRYAEAVSAYEKHIKENPDDNYYDGLGNALLCLKRYEEAISSFRRHSEIESSRAKGLFPSLNKIGTTLWLAGQRQEAMKTWHQAVAGILDRTIQYGDAAGGAAQGSLLWYGAVTLKDSFERDYALNYLGKLKKRKVYGAAILWPRPIMLMVLGEKSFAETLSIGAGFSELSECLSKAKTDLLTRRQLCQILFYAACQEREKGNETNCIQKMQLCCQLENPILEMEWYLAHGELQSN